MFALSEELLRRAVDVGFGATASQSVHRATTRLLRLPSTGGGSFNTTVQRVSGTSEGTPWSIVIKQIAADPTSAEWDREAAVYLDAGWLDAALPSGLRAPRLLASDRSDDGVTLVLEDLAASGRLAIADFASAARLLIQFNTNTVSPRPWWSSGFLTNEFQTLADHPERLEHERADARFEHLRQQLLQLSANAPQLLDICGTLPHGPAHLDAYSRNLIADPAADSIGLIDWANAGAAPLGTDPATLFVLSLNYLDANIDTIDELGRSIVNAMCSALGEQGTPAERDASVEQAVTGFHAVVRLRHLAMMMNGLPMVERADPAVSAIVGRPLDVIIEQWIAVGDHLLSGS